MQRVKIAFALAAALFLLLPLFAILPLAFTSGVLLSYPIGTPSLRWFQELGSNAIWQRSIVNSLIIGSSVTALSVTLGTMAALGLRRDVLPFGGILRTAFLLPMVIFRRLCWGLGCKYC
ncbi:MAG: hypothetical protein V9G14_17840 [Cypionkella sp.]